MSVAWTPLWAAALSLALAFVPAAGCAPCSPTADASPRRSWSTPPARPRATLDGWPAPPDERIQLITNSYIIPNMVARVVTNAATTKETMVWAETEIKRMFAR